MRTPGPLNSDPYRQVESDMMCEPPELSLFSYLEGGAPKYLTKAVFLARCAEIWKEYNSQLSRVIASGLAEQLSIFIRAFHLTCCRSRVGGLQIHSNCISDILMRFCQWQSILQLYIKYLHCTLVFAYTVLVCALCCLVWVVCLCNVWLVVCG